MKRKSKTSCFLVLIQGGQVNVFYTGSDTFNFPSIVPIIDGYVCRI